ncbi:hypothetical protein [Burkholderia aenigmatica]|uniref:hypothetical protein n=1 Tax=Burkholderia aenigmatica TaxID=2015348 RepID=UPI00264BCCA6|nr:hypothetical protein [Burkholderia aenigmatica]MDN7875182.1 hypothetical protein [Burkholderia aenigmatica]
MTAHLKKAESVLRLDDQSRYEYFVRKVADFEVVWSLFDKGGYYPYPYWCACFAGGMSMMSGIERITRMLANVPANEWRGALEARQAGA